MKKSVLLVSFILVSALTIILALFSLKIKNPQPEKCVVETKKIIKITEGTFHDIIFSDAQGDEYYINRGLERGLNLDSLNAKVLNKTVTLHLPKKFGGLATSEHIAQIAVDDEIIFTEFELNN